MDKDFNRLGAWLAPKIAARGLSVEQFGRQAEISRTSVYWYLRGTRRPTTQTMARMAHVLGASLEEALRTYTPGHVGAPRGVRRGPRVLTAHGS